MGTTQHIAFIVPRFSEEGVLGGAETLIRNLAEHTVSTGRKVTLLTTCAESHFTWENTLPPGKKQVGKLSVEYFPVDEDRDISSFLRIQTAISNGGHFTQDDEKAWIRNSVNSQALYDHLRDHGGTYDRLIMGPYLFGLIFYASQIHPEKTFLIPCLHDEPFAYLHLMKEMFETVSGFLFNAKPEQDLACRLFHIPKEKCAIVGMGLGPFHVDPSAFANRYQLDKPYVLYSGRREPLKGTPLLIDYMQAFRQRTHQDVKLVFTGSGPIDAPPELEPHILDVGFVPEQEKHEAMAGARAFLHPSVNESFGIVLLESWLAQTPALVHAKSDVLQWQCRRSGAGLWFKNYPEFEQELNLLLNNKGLNKEMGQDGRNYVIKEYAWEHVEQKLLSAFD